MQEFNTRLHPHDFVKQLWKPKDCQWDCQTQRETEKGTKYIIKHFWLVAKNILWVLCWDPEKSESGQKTNGDCPYCGEKDHNHHLQQESLANNCLSFCVILMMTFEIGFWTHKSWLSMMWTPKRSWKGTIVFLRKRETTMIIYFHKLR